MAEVSPCPGCGLELPVSDGPTHPYIGASPACWALYGELLAREYGELRYPEVHGLTVDAYAVQHPGDAERRAVQSVCVHLIGLCLAMENEVDPASTTAVRTRVAERVREEFRRLEPPVPNGTVTVRDVLAAEGPEAHADAVRRWAADVWQSWSAHHDLIRGWIDGTP